MLSSSQIFALEYADHVGELHDLVIQTFVNFTAKSCEAIIGSTTVLYLLVRIVYKKVVVYVPTILLQVVPYTSYDMWAWLQLIVIHLALNQSWIALITFIITAIPSFAHRIAPIVSAIAGFAGGFFVPTNLMPVWLV